ncbi:hypothetical protein F511_20452 [Dorcoceras hygrometricum]|uniref:Uncharacterized protein n=1 Tax=Dorcoceras hygrometricum TaxID=472368 RepID=A0A2Z7A2Y1_9LAMI|nr:hypothetical protein F511_20452 [Dorcoceras hygrometricum]
MHGAATISQSSCSTSLLRPPWPEPFRLDHPQGPGGSKETTKAPTEHARRIKNAGKEPHHARRNTHCTVRHTHTMHGAATISQSSCSTSLLRPPWPEPFRLDHPQVQAVLKRPTKAPTEHARRIKNAGKEPHHARRNTHCTVPYI